MQEKIAQAKDIVQQSRNIVFFGGAGVSTASGIPDFRSATGLYNQAAHTQYSPEYMLSHEFLQLHPDEFSDYVRNHLIYPQAEPNGAHLALAALERRGTLRAVITQNIDGLHQKAGSRRVFELHGNLTDYYCTRCGTSVASERFFDATGVFRCPECGGTVRPDVVLYGEPLNGSVLEQAVEAIREADTFIVGGSSLVVYPAAGLLNYYRGNRLILINESVTPADRRADIVLHGDISAILPQLVM
ncbi:MAG: NAD-dependent protein deacylase [Ndongobacter sp.]|nr:NAD-dependent protein deacylase [Ndongobacter sp.]